MFVSKLYKIKKIKKYLFEQKLFHLSGLSCFLFGIMYVKHNYNT